MEVAVDILGNTAVDKYYRGNLTDERRIHRRRNRPLVLEVEAAEAWEAWVWEKR